MQVVIIGARSVVFCKTLILNFMLKKYVAFFFALLFITCSTPYFPPPASNGDWRTNTDPEFIKSLGFDPAKLDSFGRWNVESDWNGNSLMHKSCIVIKDGWIVGEWYADKNGIIKSAHELDKKRARLASNGKAVAMSLFGTLVKEAGKNGIPKDLSMNSKLYDERWLAQGFPLSDPRKAEITVDHIFRHVSGILPEAQGQDRGGDMSNSAFTLGRHPTAKKAESLFFDPGHPEPWLPKSGYTSVGFNHIGLMIRGMTGKPAWQVLTDNLFTPLGIEDAGYAAELEKQDSPWLEENIRWLTSAGLWLTPRDYARFAYFLLHDGEWAGKRLVPKNWIKQFRANADYPNILGNWDGDKTLKTDYPADMFRIAGSGMNWAYVFPSQNMIALRTSQIYGVDWEPVEHEFLARLFYAMTDPPRPQKAALQFEPVKSARSGQIIVDPHHKDRLAYNKDENGDGRYDPFYMCGPGDPEEFLYLGKRLTDGTRDGIQQRHILNEIKKHGGNSLYMQIVRTHGGDAGKSDDPDWQKQNPFIDGDPQNELDQDILDQWEEWFVDMDKNGIVIYLFFYDDSATPFRGAGQDSDQERQFFTDIVNRFEHHKHLIWCIAEEYQESLDQEHVSALAAIIKKADDFNHVIAVHHATGDNSMDFRDDPNIDQFAQQAHSNSPQHLHADVLEAVFDAAGRWHVNLAENWNNRSGEKNDHFQAFQQNDRQDIRRRNWASAMAGATCMDIGPWVASDPTPAMLGDMRILQRFMESVPDLNTMKPCDNVAAIKGQWVLADIGRSYIIYSRQGNSVGLLNMIKGSYRFEWIDCLTGTRIIQDNVVVDFGMNTFTKPVRVGEEVAVYVRRK